MKVIILNFVDCIPFFCIDSFCLVLISCIDSYCSNRADHGQKFVTC